jgi:hypothetical protein
MGMYFKLKMQFIQNNRQGFDGPLQGVGIGVIKGNNFLLQEFEFINGFCSANGIQGAIIPASETILFVLHINYPCRA